MNLSTHCIITSTFAWFFELFLIFDNILILFVHCTAELVGHLYDRYFKFSIMAFLCLCFFRLGFWRCITYCCVSFCALLLCARIYTSAKRSSFPVSFSAQGKASPISQPRESGYVSNLLCGDVLSGLVCVHFPL